MVSRPQIGLYSITVYKVLQVIELVHDDVDVLFS